MSWEIIGCCGSGQSREDKDWNEFCQNMGVAYLRFVAGEMPDGCELGVIWHEDEEGEYPVVALRWGPPRNEAPAEFIHKCEILLYNFDESVTWGEIDPHHAYEHLSDEFGSELDEDDEDDDYDEEWNDEFIDDDDLDDDTPSKKYRH